MSKTDWVSYLPLTEMQANMYAAIKEPDVFYDFEPAYLDEESLAFSQDEQDRWEVDNWWDESHPVLIEDHMPGYGFGDISPGSAAYVVKDLLEHAKQEILFKKFSKVLKNNYLGSGNDGKKIKFRRYTSLPISTEPLVEGEVPKP